MLTLIQFLSTLSLRRATADCPSITVLHCNFYPRSPCGERQFSWSSIPSNRNISIHALLAESDVFALHVNGGVRLFLSTLSLRRATCRRLHNNENSAFLSTLSLRRATCLNISKLAPAFYFYPRSPCGERRCGCFARCRYWAYFYPRSPCGERLYMGVTVLGIQHISIHALLAESD